MKDWMKISLVLCIFGFLKEIRPSESFMSMYIVDTRWRNITSEQLNRDIFPVGTYSYLVQSFIMFLFTDFLRYKPLIILEGFAGILMSALLTWTTSLFGLQAAELVFGTYMSTEVAYYTYIYAKVDKKYYPKVSSHVRTATFSGKMVASFLSQALLSFGIMNYLELNYITFVAQVLATVWAFMIPSVKSSIYFNREKKPMLTGNEEGISSSNQMTTANEKKTSNPDGESSLKSFALIWSHFKKSYQNREVLIWSVWYALGCCGNYQLLCYTQVLWEDMLKGQEKTLYNAGVDGVLTLFQAIFAILAGYLHGGRLSLQQNLFLIGILSIIQGGCILLTAWTTDLYISYLGYVLFGIAFSFAITVTSAEIARSLELDSCGLVFGINVTVALLMESILTAAVVETNFFVLSIVEQYTVYGYYFVCIGCIYFLYALYCCFKNIMK